MSSRTFKARTSHSEQNPQICGLSGVTDCRQHIDGIGEVEGAIAEGDRCFYLTCLGSEASPATQIAHSKKRDDYDTGYRVTPSGQTRTVGKPPWTREVPIFKWQEWVCPQNCGLTPVACGRASHKGAWHDVEVWERMVHADCAQRAGYRVPGAKTQAHVGDRTLGLAHKVSDQAESPLLDFARAADDPPPAPKAPQAAATDSDGLDWLDKLVDVEGSQ